MYTTWVPLNRFRNVVAKLAIVESYRNAVSGFSDEFEVYISDYFSCILLELRNSFVKTWFCFRSFKVTHRSLNRFGVLLVKVKKI